MSIDPNRIQYIRSSSSPIVGGIQSAEFFAALRLELREELASHVENPKGSGRLEACALACIAQIRFEAQEIVAGVTKPNARERAERIVSRCDVLLADLQADRDAAAIESGAG